MHHLGGIGSWYKHMITQNFTDISGKLVISAYLRFFFFFLKMTQKDWHRRKGNETDYPPETNSKDHNSLLTIEQVHIL
jgi:hypothetical protein